MTKPHSSHAYHLRHDLDEDRLVIAMDVDADHEFAMVLMRRLLKDLLLVLTGVSERKNEEILGRTEAVRAKVLNFEHSHAVGEAVSGGMVQKGTPRKALVSLPRLIRQIVVTPKDPGGVSIAFNEGETILRLELDAPRLHVFIASLLDVAEKAGWDLPAIAAWLHPITAPGPARPMRAH